MKDIARIFVALVSGLVLLVLGIASSDVVAKWDRRFADVIVYTAPAPLPAGAPLSDGPYTPIPISTPTLLTWVDPMPDADFAHPTFYILIGADTGIRVVDGWWWPVLDGERYLYGWDPWKVRFPMELEDGLTEGVMVYAYPHVLTPSDELFDGDTPIPLTETTLLYWVDLLPSAFFAHPTAYILITADGLFPVQGDIRVYYGDWPPTLNGETILLGEEPTTLRFPYDRLRALPPCRR
ncbi:MAG: hypothetical protein U9Q81_13305 [Pseudomonadota bacterium]|nr:hypothetical protein [Pseudomonadota bacterium]